MSFKIAGAKQRRDAVARTKIPQTEVKFVRETAREVQKLPDPQSRSLILLFRR